MVLKGENIMQNNNGGEVLSKKELAVGMALLFMSDEAPERLPGMSSEDYLRIRFAWDTRYMKNIIRQSMREVLGIEPLALSVARG